MQNNEKETIDTCFWCGKPMDTSIDECPKDKIMKISTYDFCDRCEETYKDGIKLIGVTEEPLVEGMFPVLDEEDIKLYPTGSIMQCHEDYIKEILFDDKERLDIVLEHKLMFVPENILEKLIEEVRKAEKEIESN